MQPGELRGLSRALGLQLVACLDTNAHADPITGSWPPPAAATPARAVLQP